MSPCLIAELDKSPNEVIHASHTGQQAYDVRASTSSLSHLAEGVRKAEIHSSAHGNFNPTKCDIMQFVIHRHGVTAPGLLNFEGTIFCKGHRRPLESAGRFRMGIRDGWPLGKALCLNHRSDGLERSYAVHAISVLHR